MSIINDIEIKNFKSIRHQKIEGCKRINVFVGEPNVGKSNILEAISIFGLLDFSISQPITLQNLTRVNKNHQLFFNGLIDKNINISLNKNLELDISADTNLDLSFSAIEKFPVTAPIDTSTWKNYPKRTDFNSFQISNINEKIKATDISHLTHLNPIRPVRKYIFTKSSLTSKYDTLTKHLIFPFGENISDIIFSNSEIKNQFIKLFEIYDLRISRFEKDGKINILKELPDSSFLILDYDLIADTLQRLIFFKAAILSNKNSVLLFEEPEAHMYPPYISKFTSDMVYDENGNQFFIATHSPYVINDIMENLKKDDYAIYTVGYDKENGETLIRRMTDEELHEIYQYGVDLFLNLENFLPHAQQQ